MNDNAKKWVAELRSGKYKQTRKNLRDDIGYCCLGVACELYQEEVGDLEVRSRNGDRMYYYDNYSAVLPEKVRNWLGLFSSEGRYRSGKVSESNLTTDNDSGCTFEEIANIIESEPDGLFE